MGLSSSSDIFNRCADHLMRDIDKTWFVKVVDDILIWGRDKEECYNRFTQILETLNDNGVVASLSKIQEGTNVEFCALTISIKGDNGDVAIEPSEEKVKAIMDYPEPQSRQELCRFLGLATQLQAWSPDMRRNSMKMDQLTSDLNVWMWLDVHREEFQMVKKKICDHIRLNTYDIHKKTYLQTDGSILGLGFTLTQEDEENNIFIIAVGSAALKSTQKLLTPIEHESMAIRFALHKCEFYLRYCPAFTIRTDCSGIVDTKGKDLQTIKNSHLQKAFIDLSSLILSSISLARRTMLQMPFRGPP